MTLTPDEFWKRLQTSDLLNAARLKSIRSRIQARTEIATSTAKIARVLIANEVLTETQIRDLLSASASATEAEAEAEAGSPPTLNLAKTGSESESERMDAHAVQPPPVAINAVPERFADRAPDRQRTSNWMTALLCVTLPLALCTTFGVWWFVRKPAPTQQANTAGQATAADAARALPGSPMQAQWNGATPTGESAHDAATDDPSATWLRPQPGQPIELDLLPLGVQAVVRLRLAALLKHPEGPKVLQSLGPVMQAHLEEWLSQVGCEASNIESLVIGLLPQGTTLPQVVVVATQQLHAPPLAFPDAIDGQPGEGDGELGNGESGGGELGRVVPLGDSAVWFPPDRARTFVFGSTEIVRELSQEQDPVVLRRELEQLRQATHDTDHIIILANPNFLRDEVSGWFAGRRRTLLDGLYDFWSEETQAIFVGLQLDDVAVAEMRLIAREDLPARQFRSRTQRHMDQLPSQIADHLGRVALDPHWQRLAVRFPAMLQFVRQHSRIVAEGKQVSLSVALPPAAVHNLLLASEMALASPLNDTAIGVTNVVDRSDWTVDTLLAQSTSVRIAQKSLEFAMRDVATQVVDDMTGLPFGFSIEIVGADLQLEGITRNQQIRNFDVADQPLSKVLTALVVKANPVQNLDSAANAEQKLVWLPDAEQPGRILITTRSAALEKGLVLPSDFQK